MLNSVSKSLSSLKSVEIGLIVFFLLLVILPYTLPFWLAFLVDSSLGLTLLFIITLFLFFTFHPVLGVLFLFVSYDLLRRASSLSPPQVPTISYTPTQDKKDEQMWKMNPPESKSLEEEIVAHKAPIDGSKSTLSLVVEPSSYKPLSTPVVGGSILS